MMQNHKVAYCLSNNNINNVVKKAAIMQIQTNEGGQYSFKQK